ncbi:hypothetical protein RKD46_001222 [Streptomyces pseudovenezuelae]
MQNARAGQVAGPDDLIDVARLVTAYYTLHPDPAEPGQRVAFGTSGHRGSSLAAAFNEDHIAATSQAICEYRAAQGTDGPLFLGADTHALSEPARITALEVFAANDVTVLIDQADGYTPTPAVSHAILTHNRHRTSALADGVVVTPSHNPARRRRLQVQPAERRPRRFRGDLLDPGPCQRDHHRRPEGRTAHPVQPCPGRPRHRTPRLPRRLRGRPAERAGSRRDPLRRGTHRRRPAGRCLRRLLGPDRRGAPTRPHGGQPAHRPHLALHDAGLGRQDPHGLLVAVRHGLAHRAARPVRHRHRQRRRLRPARHRHAPTPA